ncbi:DUF881 domain-containing protein [Sediminibacillus massiliensis]|uniref:DUF881 domain-containing protein n=1 Tax=Sediminibacillus massiliensis TaxID=1926277 RepID=UPI0009888FD4|nr:DUF881 domain-containing protein [Sediminibacillus massiliensis]
MYYKHKFLISLVFCFVGFMAAILFASNREPDERDTRDLWEVRTQLQEEQKLQQHLYQQLSEAEETIDQYKAESGSDNVETLKASLEDLREKAGLTELTGEGLVIEIAPMFLENERFQTYPELTPELLSRLFNELRTYGAIDISIENERVINNTPIRYVNGKTYINNHPLPSVPLEIKVFAENPHRLLNYMEVSQSIEEFAIEDLLINLSYREEITLPKYEDSLLIETLKIADTDEAGEL